MARYIDYKKESTNINQYMVPHHRLGLTAGVFLNKTKKTTADTRYGAAALPLLDKADVADTYLILFEAFIPGSNPPVLAATTQMAPCTCGNSVHARHSYHYFLR
jgi:hypothetical protein